MYGISIYIKLSNGLKWLLNRKWILMCKQILLITDTSSKVTEQNTNLKLNPQRACLFPQYFLYFLKMAHLSCFLSQPLISPKLPDYIDFFFFHSDKTALASPALGELQSPSSPHLSLIVTSVSHSLMSPFSYWCHLSGLHTLCSFSRHCT